MNSNNLGFASRSDMELEDGASIKAMVTSEIVRQFLWLDYEISV